MNTKDEERPSAKPDKRASNKPDWHALPDTGPTEKNQPNRDPPMWSDPSQIYIPDGVTLANINPLAFVPREDVVAAFEKDGVSPKFGGCFYDHLRNLSTDALAGLFQRSGGDAAGAELLLIAIQCVIAP